MSSTPYRQALQIALAVSLLLLGRAETGLANWVINTIDSGGSGDRGFYSSITIDTQGRPQVAYSGQMGQGIRYAVLNGGLWTIEQIMGGGHRPSIALTAQDEPRIAYRQDTFPPETRYALKSGPSWTTQLVEDTGAETWGPSLALEANGDPGIAFRGGGGGFLNYAHRTTGFPWMIENPTSFENNMNNSVALALDSQGNPRIAFTDGFNLEYAERTAGVWTTTVVSNIGEDCSLALDLLDRPHISFHDEITGDLRYATRSAGVWTIQSVDTAGVTGQATAIALNLSGVPYIAYIGNGQLRFAARVGGIWRAETVNPSAQGHPAIAVDNQGRPHVAFLFGGAARYAVRTHPATEVPIGPAETVSLRVAPNPMGADGGWVSFRVPTEASAADLAVFDVSGRRVRSLDLGLGSASAIRWDGTDDSGRPVAAGIYLFRLSTNAGAETRRVSLIR